MSLWTLWWLFLKHFGFAHFSVLAKYYLFNRWVFFIIRLKIYVIFRFMCLKNLFDTKSSLYIILFNDLSLNIQNILLYFFVVSQLLSTCSYYRFKNICIYIHNLNFPFNSKFTSWGFIIYLTLWLRNDFKFHDTHSRQILQSIYDCPNFFIIQNFVPTFRGMNSCWKLFSYFAYQFCFCFHFFIFNWKIDLISIGQVCFFTQFCFIHVFFIFYSLRILEVWWMKFLNSISGKCFYSLPFSQLDGDNIWQQYCRHTHTHTDTHINYVIGGETIFIIIGVP